MQNQSLLASLGGDLCLAALLLPEGVAVLDIFVPFLEKNTFCTVTTSRKTAKTAAPMVYL